MNPRKALPAGLLLAAAAIVGGLIVAPRFKPPETLSGYVEGEPLHLAAPVAGMVRAVNVTRGQAVKAGDLLFLVDPAQVRSQLDQATAEAEAARAQAEDARKGQRPVELAIYEAGIAAAAASRARASAAAMPAS